MRKMFVIPVVGLAFVLAGCSLSGTTHQSSNAAATDHSAAQVIQMPSGFRNVAIKCVQEQGEWYALASVSDGGNGDNKDGAVSLSPDPKCSRYGP